MGDEAGDAETGDTYSHGHHASVLRSHEWRTAENSAGYLLPHLAAGQRLLDVGCGPGTITIDLATRVAPGEVLGIDPSAEVIARATASLAAVAGPERGDGGGDGGPRGGTDAGDVPGNVRFEVGDVYALDHPDGSFDVAHAHQVLQHLSDPVAALREMRRVLAPGGLLAVRDSDYGAFTWYPASAGLDRWLELYHQLTERNGAEADAGRRLGEWVRAAGFEDPTVGSSTWTFAEPESRTWWGGMWADRVLQSAFRDQAIEYGLTTDEELAELSAAWQAWSEEPEGFFAVLHGEVLARR